MGVVFNHKNLQHSHSGFTMVELLVIMVILGILSTVGVRAFNGATETANLTATINEMRNMVGLLAKMEDRLGGRVGGSWESTPTFPVTGTIRALNVAQTFIDLPEENKFSNARRLDYFFTITPTVKLYTVVPLEGINPPGFSRGAVINGATSTILEVYPRPKPVHNLKGRRKWVDNFYYKQTYEELKTRQKSNLTLPNYLRGKYVKN
jgi:prepilin-type N-terminal cleavage/methylation domain-containing protein